MTGQPTVLTICLNYRTPDMTLRAVDAALREMEGIAGEIVVVDNHSCDGSFEALKSAVEEKHWNRVRVVQSGFNGGFGAGNNFGIRQGLSDGHLPDYVYVLNSDAFPDAGAIRALLDRLEADRSLGFAGSYIHGPDGDAHVTTFRFPSIASELEGAARTGPISRVLGRFAVPIPVPENTRKVDWLAGASLMMRRVVLDQVGLFDEEFFLYFDETDLCLRASRAGWPTIFVRESEVTHIGSVSTGMKNWRQVPGYWFDSRLRYFTKNHGVIYAAIATAAHITGGLVHRLRCLLSRKPVADPPKFLATMLCHDLAVVWRFVARPFHSKPAGMRDPGSTQPENRSS